MIKNAHKCWIVPSSLRITLPKHFCQLKCALSSGRVQRVVTTQQKFCPRRGGGGGLSPHRRVDAVLAPRAARCQLLRRYVCRQVRVRQVGRGGQVWEVRKRLGTNFQLSLGGFLTIVGRLSRLSCQACWISDLSRPVR